MFRKEPKNKRFALCAQQLIVSAVTIKPLKRLEYIVTYFSLISCHKIVRECPSWKYDNQRDSGNLSTLSACALSGLCLLSCDGYLEPISIKSE